MTRTVNKYPFLFVAIYGTLKMLRNDDLKPIQINGKLSIKVPEFVIPKQFDGFSSGTFRLEKYDDQKYES